MNGTAGTGVPTSWRSTAPRPHPAPSPWQHCRPRLLTRPRHSLPDLLLQPLQPLRLLAAAAAAAASAPAAPPSSGAAAAPAPALPKPPPTGPITGAALGPLLDRFKRLQNGSDIRGIALEGVPGQPVTLTPGAVLFIGVAFAAWLRRRGHQAPVVSVGRDPRLSGPTLEAALAAGLLQGGAGGVAQCGAATTPAMFYSIVLSGGLEAAAAAPAGQAGAEGAGPGAGLGQPAAGPADAPYAGAVMLTASHLPWNSNGLKFFTAAGGLDKGDISEILGAAAVAAAEAGVDVGNPLSEQAHLLAACLAAPPARLAPAPLLPAYAALLRGLIAEGVGAAGPNRPLPLLGCRMVVDAGNGGGGFFAEQVLAPLGADTRGSVFLEPDGTFPNHPPNPEHPDAMAAAAAAVRAAGAELGIVFDTDVDRSAIVDAAGREINSNRFIALMAAVVLRERPGSTVVTDSVTSDGLTSFIERLGGTHLRYKRGYKNVIAKAVELNSQGVDCALAMETSGHGALRENYFLDDGAYLAVKAIIEHVRRKAAGQGGLSDLLAELPEPADSREWRIKIGAADYKPVGAEVLSLFHAWVTSPAAPPGWTLEAVNHEGWRVAVAEGQGRRGWLLLRQSLHDPLLVLNAESEVAGGAAALGAAVSAWLRAGRGGELPLQLGALGEL